MRDTVGTLTNDEKIIVNNFMVDFRKANSDSEVAFVSAKREKDYLRVTVIQNGREDWYHVIGKNNWY